MSKGPDHIEVFYSHPIKEQGKVVGGKLITEHNAGVTAISQAQFFSRVRFGGVDTEVLPVFLREIVRYHDLLKYLTFFQRYLRGADVDRKLKEHARGGGHIFHAACIQSEHFSGQAYLGYFLIRGHHRDLWTPTNQSADPGIARDVQVLSNYLKTQVNDLLGAYRYLIETETGITIPNFERLTIGDQLRRSAKRFADPARRSDKIPGAEAYFLTNYLFSLLIEADKLDASRNERYDRAKIAPDIIHRQLPAPETGHQLNELRHRTRLAVREKLADEQWRDYSIFTLTAPTGIGKTLTALDYALQLRDILGRERAGKYPLIVTALPFINIIEQTLEVYQQFVNPHRDLRIVGHYQFADVMGDRSDGGAEEEPEARAYSTRLMELDTWQVDIVVTSFVQLFQTLITGKNKALKKFHHLAGAIVILDEVQTVPLDKASFLGAMLHFLAKTMGTKIIMMTATQPKLIDATDTDILFPRGESMTQVSLELLDRPELLFEQFSRTVIRPLISPALTSSDDFIELFLQHWNAGQAALIVLNTVDRSIEIYEALFEALTKEGLRPNVHYLSTNVLPVDRNRKITVLKQLLRVHRSEKEQTEDYCAPILVATQVVEAGVDLDFDIGFRDIGPIDAIVQVAGRLNRENDSDRQNSPLYVVNFGPRKGKLSESQIVYGPPVVQRIEAILRDRVEILERDYYFLVGTYFSAIEEQRDEQRSRSSFKSVEWLDYDNETSGMNHFRYIEETRSTATVLIEKEEVRSAVTAFLRLREQVFADRQKFYSAKQEYDRLHKANFQKHTLAVPTRLVDGLLSKIPETDYYHVPYADLSTWYAYEADGYSLKEGTGFRRSVSQDAALGMF